MGTLGELESLYRDEYAGMVRALTLLAGSPDAAADAVQDAFVAAGVRWSTVRSLDRPGAWIRTAAVHRLLDGHRRAGRWRRVAPRLAGPASMPVDAVDADLIAAVHALPERQRAAVVLHYLADWPVDEVAAALRVAPGTVKSNLSDARAALRVRLSEGDVA